MERSFAWDQAIAARLRAGDDTALAASYDQLGPLVHGIAASLLGAQRAEDVTQDVFIELWQHPERFDPARGSLRTFLAVVARRRAIDELRSHNRRRARERRADGGAPPATVPDVEEAALAMIAADRIRKAVTRLPAEQRRAVELAYYDGLTYRDVAAAMGSPEGTTKSRLRLGLGRLARELDDRAGTRGESTWI